MRAAKANEKSTTGSFRKPKLGGAGPFFPLALVLEALVRNMSMSLHADSTTW
jgi:hypothetical protein